MDFLFAKIIFSIFATSVNSFTCDNKPIGQYCSSDLSRYHECKIISKSYIKEHIIRRCPKGTKCSCNHNKCSQKICSKYSKIPTNNMVYVALTFTGSDFTWNNEVARQGTLKGEIYEDLVKKMSMKTQTSMGSEFDCKTERFELVLPDKDDAGTFIKYFGKRKIYPPTNATSNKTTVYRECRKAKLKKFPRFLDLTQFTLVNTKNISDHLTLQTWSFRSSRMHRTTDQVRTTWKVIYDSKRQLLSPKKYRDVKKSMPGPKLMPNQRGEIRSMLFKEQPYHGKNKEFSLPSYCRGNVIWPSFIWDK